MFENHSKTLHRRFDLKLIADLVEDNSRVLDVGCGDGALLSLLTVRRGIQGRGMELDGAGVHTCVARGLRVVQGDAETDLVSYPDDAFDYAILSQTIQAMRYPYDVLLGLRRLSRKVVVSLPNFGTLAIRLKFGLTGRMPVTSHLPATWWTTQNIHLCTLKDFVTLCHATGFSIKTCLALRGNTARSSQGGIPFMANVWAEQAIFLLERAAVKS